MKRLFLAYTFTLLFANFAFAKLSIEIPEKMYATTEQALILRRGGPASDKIIGWNKQAIKNSLDYLYANKEYIKNRISKLVNSAIEPNENIIYSFLMICPDSASYDYYILTDKKLTNAAISPFLDGEDGNYFVVLDFITHNKRELKLLTAQLDELRNYKGWISPWCGTHINFLFFSVYEKNTPVNTFVLYGDFDTITPAIKNVYQTCYDFLAVLRKSRVINYFEYKKNAKISSE